MLKVLADIEARLPVMLQDGEPWNTLDVNYEPPRVERLWRQVGDHRVYLHCIHPCERALMHPHPWPSAVLIVSGQYEMGVGYGHRAAGRFISVGDVPPLATKLVLTKGARYEMVNPDGWHYVRPLWEPSLSVMVTGKPWPVDRDAAAHPGKGIAHQPLSSVMADLLLGSFQTKFPKPRLGPILTY